MTLIFVKYFNIQTTSLIKKNVGAHECIFLGYDEYDCYKFFKQM